MLRGFAGAVQDASTYERGKENQLKRNEWQKAHLSLLAETSKMVLERGNRPLLQPQFESWGTWRRHFTSFCHARKGQSCMETFVWHIPTQSSIKLLGLSSITLFLSSPFLVEVSFTVYIFTRKAFFCFY